MNKKYNLIVMALLSCTVMTRSNPVATLLRNSTTLTTAPAYLRGTQPIIVPTDNATSPSYAQGLTQQQIGGLQGPASGHIINYITLAGNTTNTTKPTFAPTSSSKEGYKMSSTSFYFIGGAIGGLFCCAFGRGEKNSETNNN